MIEQEQMTGDEKDLLGQYGCGAEGIRNTICEAVDQYFHKLDGHPTTGLYEMVLSAVEKPLIEKVLEHCSGNQTKAAMLLGINRGTFRKKLKQHDIEN